MKNLFIALFFLLSAISVSAQSLTEKQVDSIVNRALDISSSTGIAVAIVKDGKVIYSKGHGIRSIETKEKVDKNTLFAIASNSKAFTSAALAMLVDEGKITWDDKVMKYIPEFTMYNDYVAANFTIEDLLTHRSGLGLGAGDLLWFPDGNSYTINDILKSFQYQKPVSAFRTKYDYDNLLYIVAGEVVARVSGKSWTDFVQERIVDPIGMTNTKTCHLNLPKNANLAMPHSFYYGKKKQLNTYNSGELMGPAAGLYASVEDLSKWMLVQLNEGKYGDETLFSEQRQREMWYPHTVKGYSVLPRGENKSQLSAYGLGWDISDKKGKTIIGHTGGMPGMLSRTILVPELELGIVILTNTDPGGLAFYMVGETILQEYLGGNSSDLIKSGADRAASRGSQTDSVENAVWDWIAKNKTKVNQANFIGTYTDPWFGEATISVIDGKMWFVSKSSPNLTGQLFHYKASAFAVKWNYNDMPCNAFALFQLNEEGKAIGLKMKGISPNIDFSFDFQDLNFTKSE